MSLRSQRLSFKVELIAAKTGTTVTRSMLAANSAVFGLLARRMAGLSSSALRAPRELMSPSFKLEELL